MSKKRNVPSRVQRVRRLKRRNLFRTGTKATSPGSVVYIDVEREQQLQEQSTRLVIPNQFELSVDEENALDRSIDDSADILRESLMTVLSNIAGYDKATGQVEAIARDILETDVEHDNSVQSIAQAAGQLDVLCLLTERCKNVPKNVRQHFMLQSAEVIARSLPDRLTSHDKLKRHRQIMDNIIAVSRGLTNGDNQGPYISEPSPAPRQRR